MKKLLIALAVVAPFSMAQAAEHGGAAAKTKAPAAQAAEQAHEAVKKQAGEAAEHGGAAAKTKAGEAAEHGGAPVKKKVDEHAGAPMN